MLIAPLHNIDLTKEYDSFRKSEKYFRRKTSFNESVVKRLRARACILIADEWMRISIIRDVIRGKTPKCLSGAHYHKQTRLSRPLSKIIVITEY